MKNLLKTNALKSILLIAAIISTAFQSNGQQIKPSTSGYAPVNGIKVYYEVYGEGKPVVLLHGAFYTIEMNWAQLIPELSKTRKVIAIEMQGHGHTPFSDRALSITTLASDVEKLMDYLKIDSADVAGYSMGGSVAYQFAVQSPKRLRKLVIISSTYKTSGWLPIVNSGFENFKPEFFDNTPIKTTYDAVAPDKTKWRKFLAQMFAFAQVPFNVGDSNRIRHGRTCGRSTTRTNPNIAFSSYRGEILNNQEVAWKAHFRNDLQLVIEPVGDFRCKLFVFLLGAFVG